MDSRFESGEASWLHLACGSCCLQSDSERRIITDRMVVCCAF
jgi:hypothetical protein